MKWLIAAGGVLVFLILFGLYCCIVVGAREEVTRRTGAERQAGCRRGKRIEKGLHRISPRIVRTVIFGTSGNVDVQKIAAITFSRK